MTLLRWSMLTEKLIDNTADHVFVSVNASVDGEGRAYLRVWLNVNGTYSEHKVLDVFPEGDRGKNFYQLYRRAIDDVERYNRDEVLIPADLHQKLLALFNEKDF